jgi:nucleotide-binding universal stress UspA family protein
MTPPVLVAFNPESSDRGPVDFAAAVCHFTGAPLVIVAVGAGAAAGHANESLGDELRAAGLSATVTAVEHESPERGVAAAVQDLQPGLVVAGSTRRGRLGRVLLGSTGERIVQGSPCPVAVVPHGHERHTSAVRTVGAAFMPTPEGREALRAAAHIARAAGARLRVVMVLDPKHAAEESPGLLAGEHHDRDAREDIAARGRIGAEAALRAAIAELPEGLDIDPDVLFQDAADGLVAASERLDLLVLGARSSAPAGTVMMGGVARHVTSRAGCPVLVLPRGDERHIDALLAGSRTQAVE